jgi:hypothetical protein
MNLCPVAAEFRWRNMAADISKPQMLIPLPLRQAIRLIPVVHAALPCA